MVATHRLLLPLAVSAALVAVASAQPAPSQQWERGTTLTGFAGVATDSAGTGPALGGTVGWEMTPRLALEGSGTWLEVGEAASGFAGDLKLRARLWGRRHVDPFVEGGVGLYRATYDTRHDSSIPGFYRRRMAAELPETLTVRTFTDPTLVLGGGTNVFVNRRLAIRPNVGATVVLREGRRHVVTTAGVHAVFHFEEHPVTPRRRR